MGAAVKSYPEFPPRLPPAPCPYCDGRPCVRTAGHPRYPYRDDFGAVWICLECGAYVGCHKAGRGPRGFRSLPEPLGRLADQELRGAKQHVHAVFDQLWLPSRDRRGARRAAYLWLATVMDIPRHHCHIGWFSIEMCRRAWVFTTERLRKEAERAG